MTSNSYCHEKQVDCLKCGLTTFKLVATALSANVPGEGLVKLTMCSDVYNWTLGGCDLPFTLGCMVAKQHLRNNYITYQNNF